jgi:hypothetical protein
MRNLSAKKKVLLALSVVALALVLPLALAVSGAFGLWREHRARQEERAEFDGALRESLERAADTLWPAPTLGDEAVVLECPPDRLESELQRVVRLVRGAGGTASSWNDGETVRVVAGVPRSAEELFRRAVQGGVFDLASAGETKPIVMVEVVLRPSAAGH